jgi:hypothetical protein
VSFGSYHVARSIYDVLIRIEALLTDRIIDIFRRAAVQGISDKSRKVWVISSSNMCVPTCQL